MWQAPRQTLLRPDSFDVPQDARTCSMIEFVFLGPDGIQEHSIDGITFRRGARAIRQEDGPPSHSASRVVAVCGVV